MSKVFAELRELALLRCGGYCEKCANPLPESWALHHRQLKSRGGKDVIENLVALHHGCHNLDTDSVHLNPSEAHDKGLMVGSWQNPHECPITLPSGSIVMLTKEGTYTFLERNADG